MLLKKLKQNRGIRGQTIAEYLVILGLVVVASVVVISIFSDTIREKIIGVIKVFDPDADTSAAETSSLDDFQSLDKDRLN